jgi:glucans biosynthesis protein C
MDRRHDLDWLRVLLFALLVPHHVGVGFVDWGADIYRFTNNRLAGDGMTLFIYWSHSWRLPSLFLIAGIGTWFLTRRGIGPRFLASRTARLLVPAAFGFFCLNVFGGYAIARTLGEAPAFLAFWRDWILEPVPRQIQHLWFLFNLAVYTLLVWPLYALRPRLAALALPVPLLLAGLSAAAALAVVLVKPHAAALTGDGYQFGYYLVFFTGGYLIGARHEPVLAWAARFAWPLLGLAVLLFLLKAALLTLALLDDVPTGQALAAGGWVPLGLAPANASLFSIVEAATAWVWCLAALGLAARYLHRPNPHLAELNRAVFPFYVLHFPITLVGLALVARISLPWPVEFALVLAAVYAATWALWRAAGALGPVAYLVGGRPRHRRPVTGGRSRRQGCTREVAGPHPRHNRR